MHRRLITLARDTRLPLILTISAGLVAGFLTIGQAYTLSTVINNVFLNGQSLVDVQTALRLLLVLIAGRALLAWLSDVSANVVAVRIKQDLRERLFAHIFKLGQSYARGERTGELSSTVVEGIEALDAYFSQYLPQLVVAALVPLSILVFVFPLDLLSGVVLLLTAPIIPLFMYLIGKTAEALTHRQYETLSRLSAHFLDSLQGLTTLKLFGRSKSHVKTIAKVSDQFRDTTLGVLRVTFLSALVLELAATISTAIIAVEIGLRLLYSHMEFQQALFLLIIAPEFYIPVRMLGLRFHAGMAGTAAARRIFAILDTPLPAENPDIGKSPVLDTISEIVFEDVDFSYVEDSLPALSNISLRISAGQHTALVGPSGAGKSTLISLLLRFINPNSGQIRVGETPLQSIPATQWREMIAWVPQKPYLFHDTIAANLRVANPAASDEMLAQAAQVANLHVFIQNLPESYQTTIGEGGARLSGGQAQRLALARAFLKNAPILIMDEATSSLDPEQESGLEEAVRRLMRGRTVITVAHRLNTIFNADKIVFLQLGEITEVGTHKELLRKKGVYASMVQSYVGDGESLEIFADASELSYAPQEPLARTHEKELPVHNTRNKTTFIRLLGFLRGSWPWVAASVALGALTIFSAVGLMGTSAYLVSAAALHPSIASLQVAIVGVRFFGISRGVFRYYERLVSHNVTFRLLARLRIWFYTALEPLAPARLAAYRAGDLLARVTADVETLENFYVRVVAPPVVALLVASLTSLFLASFTPLLGWVLFAFLFALGIFIPAFSQLLGRKPGAQLVAQRAALHTQLVDGVQGISDLLAFGREKDRQNILAETGKRYKRAQLRMAFVTGLNSASAVLLANLGMWAILFFSIPLVSEGIIPGVMLAVLALVSLAAFEAVSPLPQAAQMLNQTKESARRLFEIADTAEVVQSAGVKLELPRFENIRVEGLRFSYNKTDFPALNGIDFELSDGKRLAVVGPSGAGKSTLINLLMRFWEHTDGQITINGQAINFYNAEDVRGLFAVVPQNAFFFNATILQNLLIANPKATSEQVEQVARQARIHDFVRGLPSGYDTWIGEQGLRLSGGERQRLAIARALLKPARILLLDEPSANLDAVTERMFMSELLSTVSERTTLLITHRLVGLAAFDEILVLENGRVAERGTHSALLSRRGLYWNLSRLQNRILFAS